MDNKSRGLIALPLVLAVALSVAAGRVSWRNDLSEIENQTLEFRLTELKIMERSDANIKMAGKNPMGFRFLRPVHKKASPEHKEVSAVSHLVIKENDLVNRKQYEDSSLSLIVISGKNKMAIIKGVLVKEGDAIENTLIARIEPERVLIKNKISKWLHLERVK